MAITIPSSLTPEHTIDLSLKARSLVSGSGSPIEVAGDEGLTKQLLDAGSRLFLERYGFNYADHDSTPPDLKPGSSVTALSALVTVALDNVTQVRKYSEEALSINENPEWFITRFVNDAAIRAQEFFNISDPDRWAHSSLMASYGNPDDGSDRIEVRTIYLYTNIELSEGGTHTVIYYLGVYFRAS